MSTGDEAGATQALPRDLPSQCQPRLASSCSVTSYSWKVFWAHCFDRRQEFLVPLTSSAQKCRLWWLWLVVHLRDKGTGQPAHSW